MTKYFTLIAIIAFRIFFHPGYSANAKVPFTSLQDTPHYIKQTASLLNVNATISKNKVFLNWVVSENETADMFEVEKSEDGKNFSLAAIVFGTDNAKDESYQFYEKAKFKKIFYRIKLINKNKETAYSTLIEVSLKA